MFAVCVCPSAIWGHVLKTSRRRWSHGDSASSDNSSYEYASELWGFGSVEGAASSSLGASSYDAFSSSGAPLPAGASAPDPRQAISAPRLRWGANTSGPFFTGTAEVEPEGSWYLEPYMFDFVKNGSAALSFPQKMAIGMGHHLEFDVIVPLTQNRVGPSATPAGQSISEFGAGDAHLSFKYQLTSDANTYSFWARPAMTLTADFFLPSGNYSNLNPALYGADQFGNGTFDEGVSLLVRKRAKPFVLYGQAGYLIQNPANVGPGYGFNNQIGLVPPGVDFRMVDGDLFYYSTAFEYVLNTRHGIGFLAEMAGEAQRAHSFFYGDATAPSFSYLTLSPEVEATWPSTKQFAITWGAGVALQVERSNFPRVVTPMATATLYFNGPKGGRGSH